MVQRVSVVLEDDIDGGTADETVTFGLDGVSYEIDLSDANASKLRDALAPWVGQARRAGGRKATGARSSKPRASRGSDASAIRAWAADNGHTVSERGRIPAEVREAYEAAH
ncbi:histone-like nucleoid-structuring protein Lsr2 [Litorihabitans aurantiacus]|uniref:Lsr2 family protein n=1 Tax=Litorihabitans aurantiacus TaxID=1930061 RepID=A0AA38CU64_9MICO|nr:Lsr2 family protein [Litorihabitans aurantiacus]GMA32439.1 Lsr2 family protein [Litorihabitans aurantiacus]